MSHAPASRMTSSPLLRGLIFSRQPQGPRERHCRGFMPCGNESEKVPGQFLIVQGTAGLWIARRNEEVQHIVVMRRAGAPSDHDLIRLAPQIGGRLPHFEASRMGEGFRQARTRQ
jgi:hypothetical protein